MLALADSTCMRHPLGRRGSDVYVGDIQDVLNRAVLLGGSALGRHAVHRE